MKKSFLIPINSLINGLIKISNLFFVDELNRFQEKWKDKNKGIYFHNTLEALGLLLLKYFYSKEEMEIVME